jgi:hypothetical protein
MKKVIIVIMVLFSNLCFASTEDVIKLGHTIWLTGFTISFIAGEPSETEGTFNKNVLTYDMLYIISDGFRTEYARHLTDDKWLLLGWQIFEEDSPPDMKPAVDVEGFYHSIYFGYRIQPEPRVSSRLAFYYQFNIAYNYIDLTDNFNNLEYSDGNTYLGATIGWSNVYTRKRWHLDFGFGLSIGKETLYKPTNDYQ